MTLEQQSNNVKALIDYRNALTEPTEGLRILLKCSQEFKDVDLVSLSQELLKHGPSRFIKENLPDPFGIEEALTEPFSFTKLYADKDFREKYNANLNRLILSDEEITKISSQFTPRFSTPEEQVTYLEYLYCKLEDFWRYIADKQSETEQPTKGILEDYLSEECGIEYRTLINSGVVLSTFQEILKCKNRQEKLVLIKNNSSSSNSIPRKDRCLAFIIGLGDWGNDVHQSLLKFGYSLVDKFDHELALKYLLTLERRGTGRENLEWINTVLERVLDTDNYKKYRFAMPGERAEKKS